MIVGDVMDELGNRLKVIQGLKVKDYDGDTIETPCALVSLPAPINYGGTYHHGMVAQTFVVTTLVATVDERIRRDQIAPYGDSAGPKSILQALESGTTTAFDTISVDTGIFGIITINKIEYLGLIHTVSITGR